MHCTFIIPSQLREYTRDRAEIRVGGDASSVSDALLLLWRECPALRDRVLTELGNVRPHINIFVDGDSVRDRGGLGADVPDGAEIYILPAVSGG